MYGEWRQCQYGVGPASQATPAIVRGWPRPAKTGGCPELDLILWQGVLEGELVEASRLGRLLIHIQARSIDRPTGSSSRGPGSRKAPPVVRPSVSSNCIVTCSSPPARARPPARKFSSRRTPSSGYRYHPAPGIAAENPSTFQILHKTNMRLFAYATYYAYAIAIV